MNQLLLHLRLTAPYVNLREVLATGATERRAVFSASQIPGIITAYRDGIRVAFAVAMAGVGISFIFTFFNSWKRLDTRILRSGEGIA